MPTKNRVGTEGPGNQTIGGVPAVHYLNFASKGRGQTIRLFFEDAGIAYDDIRYGLPDEYQNFKKNELAQLNPLTTVPVVELNGRIHTQSYAILRHFARVLGKYEGKTEEEVYWADRINDAVADWRTKFVAAFLSPNKDKDYPAHKEGVRKTFLNGINTLLAGNELSQQGPYIIGKEITYADIVLYQVIHDEGLNKDGQKELKDGGYNRLAELTAAVEARPAVAAFLKSDRYLG